MNRRQFIKKAAVAGTAVAVLGGSGYLVSKSPNISYYESQNTLASIGPGEGKLLIAYASKHGSTGDVAKEIATVFEEAGVITDVMLIDNVKSLADYDKVIIGAPVRMSKWLQEATDFVQANKSHLNQCKVAYFLTCMVLAEDNPSPDKVQGIHNILDHMERAVPRVSVSHKGFFTGAMDYSKMSLAMKVGLKIMSNSDAANIVEGDFRDWDAIRSWASEVRERFEV